MTKTVEQIYQDIATHLQKTINEEWSAIWIQANASIDDVLTLEGHYYPLENTEARSFPVFPTLIRYFEQLREYIQHEGQNAWLEAIYTLRDDGTFELELSY